MAPSFQILDFCTETSSVLSQSACDVIRTAAAHRSAGLHRESSVQSIMPVGADRFRDLPLLPRMLNDPNVVTIHPQPSPLPGSFWQETYWRWHWLSPPGHSVFYRRPHLLSSTPHNHSLTESSPEQLLLSAKTELITPTFTRPQHFVGVLVHP